MSQSFAPDTRPEIVLTSHAYQTTKSCLIPAPGNYSFESVAMTGELVGLGQGFVLALEKAPPMGNLGVVCILAGSYNFELHSTLTRCSCPQWTLTSADQGGFQITNVELARNVVTTHLVESVSFFLFIHEIEYPKSHLHVRISSSPSSQMPASQELPTRYNVPVQILLYTLYVLIACRDYPNKFSCHIYRLKLSMQISYGPLSQVRAKVT